MFKKILIANRGEIACRVAATARRMGIKTVAVYSDADAQAKHVQLCDEAVHIGGNAPQDSYLRWERILQAAQDTGAQAVHPGYGFLSENEDFASACAQAGLVFIGPSPASIRAMGLKAQSKRLMEAAGVPLVPGYHGTAQDADVLQSEADRIGYPVLIKASAGGGGKGMRVVEDAASFAQALASCQREAMHSFGDDAVLIEKYVQRPRHIEIQIFGDTHGHCVYLFERDCSVQRRHQKVLEEAPAPGLSPALRERMGAAAVAAAKAVNYVGAGTVEFIVSQTDYDQPESMTFFFMEMNTRLQVEHPVTEAITGLDLVEWQLRVANGEPLPCQQADLRIQGHAIEARICAENPDHQFLPATGHLHIYRKPVCQSFEVGAVRMDDGVREGDTISPFYDSMIAKLIVHGETRAQALVKLDEALAQTHIVGVSNNVQFLRHVVASASFAQARLDTALIQREEKALFHQEPVGFPLAAACVVAHMLAQEQRLQNDDPWSRRDGWRAFGVATRTFDLAFHDQQHTANLTYAHDGALHLQVEQIAGELRWQQQTDTLRIEWAGHRVSAQVFVQDNGEAHVFTPQGATRVKWVDALAHAGEVQEAGGRLSAPMPGKVVSFLVNTGDKVKAGQALAVMEAMKMEHTIAAPVDGEVIELLYAPGDQVAEGAELLKLKP
ncbi:MAG: Acetyl-/propionyl-coenzyme carboxylase alpha chain [Pseudomonadota bacterium]